MERPKQPRPRGLVHQRRPPAGQGRRYAAARRRGAARRAARQAARGQGRRHRRPGVPQHHPRRRRPQASWPAPSSRPGRRTAATTPSRRRTSINLEFISANPTGPLHLGHTRWAALGDAMRRLLEAAGADVDGRVLHQRRRRADGQVRRLGAGPRPRASPRPRAATPAPTSTTSPSRRWPQRPDLLELPDDEAARGGRASSATRPSSRTSRTRSPTSASHFDVWFSEADAARRRRRRARPSTGCASRATSSTQDGAVWLRTTDFGDDKDRVLIRANGEPTYFAADAAYYLTSRTAASTRRSTCSAPTTTATSTGSRRSRPARATTRSTTSRCRSASWSTSAAPSCPSGPATSSSCAT